MANLNKIFLIGNLTRDPELTFIANGTAVVKATIAVNENWTNKEGEKRSSVQFINLTIWGKGGEIFQKYTQKGSMVHVEGKLEIDKVEKNGVNQYYTNVIVKEFQFLDRKGDKNGSGGSKGQYGEAQAGVDPGFAGLPEAGAEATTETDWAIPSSDGDGTAALPDSEAAAPATAPADAVMDDSDIPF